MSTIKVNTITTRSGSTITLGESGKTITLACGASQSGFGRTGTVDWCTTAKTSPFTSASGKGYFVNTTGGAVTVTLPASPSGGDIVAIKDYAKTFDTNAVTLGRNSSKIGGACVDATLDTEGISTTLVYVDGTQGWLVVNDGKQSEASTAQFVAATGGCISTCGDYKIHTFNSDANFVVSNAGNACGSNTVDYLVVAGGGGGGVCMGGGGGAGGYRESSGAASGSYTRSPLGACVSALPVSASTYPITVGAGGAGSTSPCSANPTPKGTPGSTSTFSTISSAGGGGGGSRNYGHLGLAGGSGGGNANDSPSSNVNPAGNTPPVSPPQGQPGGFGRGNTGINTSGGGGGATAAGGNGSGPGPSPVMGPGGAGATSHITGSPVGRAGGGAGGRYSGAGGQVAGTVSDGGALGGPNADDGTANKGGGGGGGGHTSDPGTQHGGDGGSGVVIIRYKYQ
jgi:hypothetical protein